MTRGGTAAALMLGAWLALTAAVATPGFAQSDDLDAEGRALFEAGRVAFDAGRYEDALEHFQNAYERSRRPRLLYNVGLAADRLGQRDLAIRAYQKFMDSVDDSEHRPTVEGRLAVLRAEAAASPEPAPPPEPEPVPVVTTTTPTPPVQTAPVYEPTPARGPVEQPSRLIPALTVAGGALFAIGGLGLIGAAFSAKSDAEATDMWPRANDANQSARLRSGAGFILVGVGVVALLVGVIWLKVTKRARYGIAIGPDRFELRGTF